MKKHEPKKAEADWWDELSPSEQAELLEAIAESEDESNLVPAEEAEAMIQSWLIKKAE